MSNAFGIVNIAGSAALRSTVPNNAALIGTSAAMQAANVDAGANAFGLATTPGHAVRLGK